MLPCLVRYSNIELDKGQFVFKQAGSLILIAVSKCFEFESLIKWNQFDRTFYVQVQNFQDREKLSLIYISRVHKTVELPNYADSQWDKLVKKSAVML